MKLYSYWRSSCSWRVRIGLSLKGIEYETVPVHLVREGGEQHADAYKALNPMEQVPLLEVPCAGGAPIHIGQSLAILEFLEETVPEPSLLPGTAAQRARIRQLAEIVNAGIQPLQNLRIIRKLTRAGVDDKAWCADVIERGLASLEVLARDEAGRFLVGDEPTLADICLVPQLYNARRFGVHLANFESLLAAEKSCEALESFANAHPDRQPDASASG